MQTSAVSAAALAARAATVPVFKLDHLAWARLVEVLAHHCGGRMREDMFEDAETIRKDVTNEVDRYDWECAVYRTVSRIVRIYHMNPTVVVAAQDKAECRGLVDRVVEFVASTGLDKAMGVEVRDTSDRVPTEGRE